MEWSTILTSIIASVAVNIVGLIFSNIRNTAKNDEKFKNIEKSLEKREKEQEALEFRMRQEELNSVLFKTYDDRIIKLDTAWSHFLQIKMASANSPLKLTLYAQQLFKDIGFDKTFDGIKDELVQKVKQYNPRTKYDVQEFSRYVLYENRNSPILDNLKKTVFEKGKNLDEILGGAFIPLRDYYLEKHPEIKD